LNEDVFVVNDFAEEFDFVADVFAAAGAGTRSLLLLLLLVMVVQMTAGAAGRFADASDGIDGRAASQTGLMVVRQSSGRTSSAPRQRHGDTGHLLWSNSDKTVISGENRCSFSSRKLK
jgi:hypothetical protein